MDNKSYSYLLGQYLGDGCVSETKRTYTLRIFNDVKYNHLNDYIFQTIQKIFPNNKVNTCFYQNHVITYVYSNEIPKLFPQHNLGLKKNRKIQLYDWQIKILDYKYLFAGLLHSDGCIYFDRGYKMCVFTNTSLDILDIFKDCCDKLNIEYTINKNRIQIRKRKSNDWIEENVGDKNIIKI